MPLKIFLRRLIKIPILGPSLLMVYRFKVVSTYFAGNIKTLMIWLFRSKEYTNFSYDLSDLNKQYLIAFVSQVTKVNHETIQTYIAELENDNELRNHIEKTIKTSERCYGADIPVKYARRLGWYAIVRATKPQVVVETGVDKGLGACVLTAALAKNHEEGYEGYYYGTDINPEAGYLLQGKYARFGEILYGDSIESLRQFAKIIDIFINDSDHSSEYEAEEYNTIKDKLSEKTIVLGDNAHCTDKLLKFAAQTGRQFLFFAEKPDQHWYPGAGIGVAFNKNIVVD